MLVIADGIHRITDPREQGMGNIISDEHALTQLQRSNAPCRYEGCRADVRRWRLISIPSPWVWHLAPVSSVLCAPVPVDR